MHLILAIGQTYNIGTDARLLETGAEEHRFRHDKLQRFRNGNVQLHRLGVFGRIKGFDLDGQRVFFGIPDFAFNVDDSLRDMLRCADEYGPIFQRSNRLIYRSASGGFLKSSI